MTTFGQPPLESRHVVLRPPTRMFVEQLYEMATLGEVPWIWSGGNGTPDQFFHAFYDGVAAQFAILDRRNGEPIGLLSATEANPIHGIAYFSILLLPTRQRQVWPLEALVLFTNYMFITHNLRRLYSRTAEDHFGQFKSGSGRYFEVEGHLKGQLILFGEEKDMYLLTITRDRWSEVFLPLLERITNPLVPSRLG